METGNQIELNNKVEKFIAYREHYSDSEDELTGFSA